MLARLEQRVTEAGLNNITIKLGDITTGAGLPPDSFDRAWLVTVLGEIPDRAAALRWIYRLLKPGGTLSITEIMGDPHYQRRSVVLRLGQEAGFEPTVYWRNGWAFTQNFVK
jgi:ubiquinone/menaquinone biosynthesis C-methylase UbiE